MANFQEILNFWFGKPDEPTYGQPQKKWFLKNTDFDNELRSRFLEIYQKAALGPLDIWKKSPLSCLALIIIFDQFPRNMFRDTPKAFATDDKALNLAKYAVDNRFDTEILPVQRWFIYCPFEHSENLEDQQKAVELFSTLKENTDSASAINYAHSHLKVIEQFGRFPHRNKILGRPRVDVVVNCSGVFRDLFINQMNLLDQAVKLAAEEEEFLKHPGSSF